MFIRKRKLGKKTYYYIVESKRDGKAISQKVLAYLGTAENILKVFKEKNNALN